MLGPSPAALGVAPAREIRLEAAELARTIADDLADKQAEEIVVLDISELTDFADYFVIANGTSRRHLAALEEAIVQADASKPRREGSAEGGWRLFDFGGVVVHLFDPETRAFYDLEGLWREARQLLRIQ